MINLHHGDSRQLIGRLPEKSVHLVVTSPPYFSIKDYDNEDQIGLGQSYQTYIDDLKTIIEGCYRALYPGCRMAVNIGDQYLSAKEFGTYSVLPIQADLINVGRAVGFNFMGNIIWNKISTTKTSGGGVFMGSLYHPKDGHVTFEHEYILLFRKPGKWPKPSIEEKELSKVTKEQRSEWWRGLWKIAPARQNKGHPAVFPIEIPERLIRMYSFVGETVLDPFAGTSTTGKAALKCGRKYIGFELNDNFMDLSVDNLL